MNLIAAGAALAASLFAAPVSAQVGPPVPDALPAQPAAPEPETTQYKDWVLQCVKPEGQLRRCVMRQAVLSGSNIEGVAENTQIAGLEVGFLPGSTDPLLKIIMPLGVLLPPGLAIHVDDEPTMRAPFQQCRNSGCEAIFPMKSELVETMKAGKKAKVIFQDAAKQNLSIPFSLSGFTAGYSELLK
jgi:invasion protein IalB